MGFFGMKIAHVDTELSPQLLAAVEDMPAFPKSAQAILALTQDMACSPKELARVIEKDPVVTLKVLRVVNSAYYRLPDPIASIDHAVVFLGLNTIKNLALSISALHTVHASPLSHFDAPRYLMHSLVTASVASRLEHGSASHDYFMVGLLHDFGKVVIAHAMPKMYCRALEMSFWNSLTLHQALEDVVGVDDALVGARLIEQWHFPDDLVQSIRYQNTPLAMDTNMMAHLVAAVRISNHLGYGFGAREGVVQPLPHTVIKRLGADLPELVRRLGDISALLEDAKHYAQSDLVEGIAP
ncbi:signal transduction protein [Candidatus Symbiobacter mobilis CR]|uniref:Signal transduction protein n=2 Tax=Candidatus Symbiobacter TaxID=1436289 RepID=U5N4X5_9BURK|nr:signal transduction protein [Candidatus Symbiobacter mobilis CR]